MTDFLDQKRSEISKRLGELRPLVDEYHRLEAASSALGQLGGARTATSTATRSTGTRRRPGRPRNTTAGASKPATASTRGRRATATKRRPASTAATSSSSPQASSTAAGTAAAARRPGRRRGSGARTAQTLQLVQAASGGITIPELAGKMGIKQNYLYRVLPALQQEGKIRKRGRSWYPKAA